MNECVTEHVTFAATNPLYLNHHLKLGDKKES